MAEEFGLGPQARRRVIGRHLIDRHVDSDVTAPRVGKPVTSVRVVAVDSEPAHLVAPSQGAGVGAVVENDQPTGAHQAVHVGHEPTSFGLYREPGTNRHVERAEVPVDRSPRYQLEPPLGIQTHAHLDPALSCPLDHVEGEVVEQLVGDDDGSGSDRLRGLAEAGKGRMFGVPAPLDR